MFGKLENTKPEGKEPSSKGAWKRGIGDITGYEREYKGNLSRERQGVEAWELGEFPR